MTAVRINLNFLSQMVLLKDQDVVNTSLLVNFSCEQFHWDYL